MDSARRPSARKVQTAGLTAVAQVAERIREDVFQLPDGTFLGSEDDLLQRYGASRPTFRQAVALVAQEQLLRTRRGVGGGFFVRRPDPNVVTHIVSQYLRSRDVGLKELSAAIGPLRVEIARLAALSPDEAARAEFAAFLAEEKANDENLDFPAFLMSERRFNRMLGMMSGSVTLSLFFESLLDLSSRVHRKDDIYGGRAERLISYRRERLRLAQAVVEGDDELAILAARRCTRMGQEWLMQQLQEREARQAS